MLPLNKSYKNRKVSLTIHCKYKYFDSTVQRAEDRRRKFYFCRLPFAVNVKLNLSIVRKALLSDVKAAFRFTPALTTDWTVGFVPFGFITKILSRANCAISPCICFIFGGNFRQGFRSLLNRN